MNYNNFNDPMNQSPFMFRSQAGGNKENQVYDQYDIHSHGHSVPKHFYPDNNRPQQRYPSSAGQSSFADMAGGPSEVYPFEARGGGSSGFYARAGPSHAYGYEDNTGCVREDNFVNRSYGRDVSYGRHMGIENVNPGTSMMDAPIHAQEVPRMLDVPRAPGAPRPLTTSPGRPLFRPMDSSIAPPRMPTQTASVQGYGFFGLTQPKPPAAAAYGDGYSVPAASPQGFAWPPMPVGATSAAAPSSSSEKQIAGGSPLATQQGPRKTFTPKQVQASQKQRTPPTPPTLQDKRSKGKEPAAVVQPPPARRSANRPPALRLLSGSVQQVTEWLHLSQQHTLLFEVFGVLSTLSPASAGQPRRLRLTDAASGAGSRALEALFWEIDRPLHAAAVAPGQSVRVVGRALSRGRVQAFSASVASDAEMALVRRLAFLSQRVASDLVNEDTKSDDAPWEAGRNRTTALRR